MLGSAAEQRRHSRISTVPHIVPEGDAPGRPRIINVSQGGACIWLRDPPPLERGLTLHFQSDGRDHVLRSRIVWSRLCTAAERGVDRQDGWIAGIAFAGEDADLFGGDAPHEVVRAGHARVSVLPAGERPDGRSAKRGEPGVIALNEQSIPGLKAATRDLVPVFARHFSDVRLVLTRQRLEISASFRPPAGAHAPEAGRRERRALRRGTVSPVDAQPATSAEPAAATQARSRRAWLAAGLAVAGLAGLYLAGARRPAVTTPVAAPRQSPPAWALGLDDALVEGWTGIKAGFGLSDENVRSVIQILRDNDKYPSAHDLHDLAKYPVEAARAFALLVQTQVAPGEVRALKEDLESRLMAGARFPDEAPGGRYSTLQRELYNNVVVLGVVDLFYRRRDEPAVRRALAALRSGQQQATVAEGA